MWPSSRGWREGWVNPCTFKPEPMSDRGKNPSKEVEVGIVTGDNQKLKDKKV